MYKFLLTVAFLVMGSLVLFAQTKPTPLSVRRVNGVVKDSLGKTIPMASVRLLSAKDTFSTVTSEYGVFNFPAVRSADFIIQVQVMSYHPYHKKYFLNDTRPILVLPPVMMTSSLVQLKGIVVTTAKGPQERGDTTEFWAKDYIVRDYARLEDLLKRMEGVSIDANGMLNYRGKPVSRALFNGKKYFNGDVMSAIRELPADIVERIQIIDDNADGTGPKIAKSDASSKTLNIVTKADKSAGRMYQTNLEAGTRDRYQVGLSAKSVDAARQWNVMVGASQEPLGVASGLRPGAISNLVSTFGFSGGGGGGMSGGTSKNRMATLQYNNEYGKLNYNISYQFSDRESVSETESVSEEFFEEGSIMKRQKSAATNSSTSHRLAIGATINQKNFSMFTNMEASLGKDKNDNFRETQQTGMLENLQRVSNSAGSNRPQVTFFSRMQLFQMRKVVLDVNVSSRYTGTKGSGNESTDIYGLNAGKPDSSLSLQQKTNRGTMANELQTSLDYGRGKKLQLRLSTGFSQQQSNNSNYRDEIREGQAPKRMNDLSNDNILTNYSLPAKFALIYNFSEDFTMELNSTYETNWQHGIFRTRDLDLSTQQTNFLPGFNLRYGNLKAGNLSFVYAKRVQLPDLLQLNASPYYNTPFDVTIGNKDLSASLASTWTASYTYFIPKIDVDVNVAASYNKTTNAIVADRRIQIDTTTKTMRTETHYSNVNGADGKSANYGMSKNFPAMKMTLRLNGGLTRGKEVYFANGVQQLNNRASTYHNLNAVVTIFKWLDLTPDLSYRTDNSKNSLAMGAPIYNKEFKGSLNGAIILPQQVTINFNAVQNITEATNLLTSAHPFVINANIEMRFLKRKDAIISFVVMDALQQNRNTSFGQLQNGYVNYVSNSKSRYFLCQFAWYPQRFTRSKSAKGVRRGDGSFTN